MCHINITYLHTDCVRAVWDILYRITVLEGKMLSNSSNKEFHTIRLNLLTNLLKKESKHLKETQRVIS